MRGALGAFPQGKIAQGKPSVSATTVGQVDTEDAAAVGEEAMASFPYSITAGLEKGAKNRQVASFKHMLFRLLIRAFAGTGISGPLSMHVLGCARRNRTTTIT